MQYVTLDLQMFCTSHCIVREGNSGGGNSKRRHFYFPACAQRRQAGRDLRGTITFICDNWDRASVSCLSTGSEGLRAGESEVKTQEVIGGEGKGGSSRGGERAHEYDAVSRVQISLGGLQQYKSSAEFFVFQLLT